MTRWMDEALLRAQDRVEELEIRALTTEAELVGARAAVDALIGAIYDRPLAEYEAKGVEIAEALIAGDLSGR